MKTLAKWAVAAALAASLPLGALAVGQTLTVKPKAQVEFTQEQIDEALRVFADSIGNGADKQAFSQWIKSSDPLTRKQFFTGDTTIQQDFKPKPKGGPLPPPPVYSVAQDIIYDEPSLGWKSCKLRCRKTTLDCSDGPPKCKIRASDCDCL